MLKEVGQMTLAELDDNNINKTEPIQAVKVINERGILGGAVCGVGAGPPVGGAVGLLGGNDIAGCGGVGVGGPRVLAPLALLGSLGTPPANMPPPPPPPPPPGREPPPELPLSNCLVLPHKEAVTRQQKISTRNQQKLTARLKNVR
jgi:hypothetical protein